jgi:hypothetical protein
MLHKIANLHNWLKTTEIKFYLRISPGSPLLVRRYQGFACKSDQALHQKHIYNLHLVGGPQIANPHILLTYKISKISKPSASEEIGGFPIAD